MKNVLVTCLCLFSSILIAQTSAKIDTVQIDAIVVTASKKKTPSSKTTKVVRVVNKEDLRGYAGGDLTQVLQDVAGIYVNGAYSNFGKDKSPSINGGSYASALILVDGQPISDPSNIGSTFDIRLLPIGQIERIEILPESQSTLYGSSAMSGIINIITKKDIEKPIVLSGNVGAGQLNTWKLDLAASGRLYERIGYNIGTNLFGTDGISEAATPQDLSAFKNDPMKNQNFHARLDVDLSDAWRLSPLAKWSDYSADYDGGSFVDADNKYVANSLFGGASLTYDKDRLQGELNLNATKTDREYVSQWGKNKYKGRQNQLDAWVNYDINSNLSVLIGTNYQQIKVLDTASTVKDPSDNIFASYVNAIVNVGMWHLEGGLRYNNHSKFGSNVNYSLSSSYWISPSVKVLGGIATGFKAPDLSQLYGAFGPNPDLKPMKSRSANVGVLLTNASKNFTAQMGYFNRRITDVIAYDFSKGYLNRDLQKNSGWTAEVTFKPTKNSALMANYTWNQGKTISNNVEMDNVRIPEHQVGLGIRFNPITNLSVRVNTQYVGDRTDLYIDPATFKSSIVDLEDYFLVNAFVEYRLWNDRMGIYLDAKNITNTEFQEVYGFNGLGLQMMGGVRFEF